MALRRVRTDPSEGGDPVSRPGSSPGSGLGSRPASIRRVDDLDAWRAIAHTAGAALPGAEVVKIVVDRRTDPWEPHFLDTVRFQHHVDFCRRLDPRSNARFDEVMYRSPDRPFVLLTMTRLPRPEEEGVDLWWLELWPGDDLDAATMVETVGLLRAATFLGPRLLVKGSSDDQRQRFEPVLAPLLDQGQVWRGQSYQALTRGTAYGRLRILRDGPGLATELASLTPFDVVVTESIPLDIAAVSALVTAEHQTPLAHVAVLSANRGSPNCAVVGAHALPEVVALEGQWVQLSVERTSWRIEPAREAVARAHVDRRLAQMRAGAPALRLSSGVRGLVDLASRASRDVSVVGAKSAALADLRRDRRLRRLVPPGVTVPLGVYADHVRGDATCAALLGRLHRADASVGSAGELLAELRAAILAVPVEPALVASVRAAASSMAASSMEASSMEASSMEVGGDLILRSSSNCEDLPGFNGAGLADSVRVAAPVTDEAVADALRRVWASLWSDRGWAERAAFGIDQAPAAMAVLVQPVVPHTAHVVAITTNPVRPSALPAYLLNLLPSGALVTDADSANAEQLLVFDDDPACAEVLCLAGGRDASLLPETLVGQVRDVLKRVDRRVQRRSGGRAPAADVELLLGPGGDFAGAPLVLLQARPWGTA